MASRAIWKGQLQLSLLAIPVEIHSATKSGGQIGVRRIHGPGGKPVPHEDALPGLGPVRSEDIPKGHEVGENACMLLKPQETDTIRLETKKTFELAQFVDACGVGRDALRRRAKVGLGQPSLRGREHLCAVKPCGNALLMETLFCEDESRAAARPFVGIGDAAPNEDLLAFAKELAKARRDEVTMYARLRPAAVVTLREDKPAMEVGMDASQEARVTTGGRVEVAGIGISNPGRRVFSPDGPTKLDLARYYQAVAPRMLAVAADRPLSLVRLPDGLGGQRFFQRHLPKGWPSAVRPVPVETADGVEDYMYLRDAAGLVGAVQMGTVEFHVWGSRRDRLEKPDRMVFDLDPDEGLDWPDVRRAAFDLRGVLEGLGLPSWPMVTGGKGVHVTVRLRRTVGWDTVKLFSRTVATHLSETQPERFLATMSKAKREDRIFIDYLRNERGATAIAPFSIRARPGATVAFPLSWDALEKVPGANAYDMERALAEGDWNAVGVPKPVSLEAAVKKMTKAWGQPS